MGGRSLSEMWVIGLAFLSIAWLGHGIAKVGDGEPSDGFRAYDRIRDSAYTALSLFVGIVGIGCLFASAYGALTGQ